MRERQEAVDERRLAVLRAARDLFLAEAYDEVSLQAVADAAGVSLKTVVRQFGTKEALVTEIAERLAPAEFERRAVRPGDVAAVAAVLAERYEALAKSTMRLLELERRIEALARVLRVARLGHRDWLAGVFEPWIPANGATRERRLACLFGATEIYVWISWREHLGMSRADAEATMRESLQSLVDAWKRKGAA